ncbi:glycosyltransferase, GT2 family [Terrimicrobium sacchariphilum]|uniref:Glycosyltransferase, GT2 family n=1 Tax=Terrimicrobium sacchariphilum TaxID=690879 RepID=A0A146G9C5_TERSA|nr:glycosyltransferase [Terrimicrobium sacchariphilum]GAT34279.1 glycosyltransferase, GT2 family [Terrimicrobium sacchariphilum]
MTNDTTRNAAKVYVVIPVYNRLELTLGCLACLEKQDYRNFESILVDDASTDGTSDLVAEKYPTTRIIRTVGDRWWTGATNDGIRLAMETASDDDYILLLNNDLVFPPNLLRVLTSTQNAKGKNSVIGAITLDSRDGKTIRNGGTNLNPWTMKFSFPNAGRSIAEFSSGHVEPTVYQTGRGVLYPAWIFRKYGMFDDIHFKQCGDCEFPLRLAHQGISLWIAYDAQVQTNDKDTAQINHTVRKKLSDWREYFFGVRSNTNLKYQYYFARAASRPFYRPLGIGIYLSRVFLGFAKRVVR